MALRRRIALAFAGVIAVLLAVVGLQLRAAILRQTTQNLRERLLAEARLAASTAPSLTSESDEAISIWARTLDERLGARVTLIDSGGSVLADSQYDADTMENHGDRPERLGAIRSGWGSAIRASRTLRIDMLYVAVPLESSQQPPHVLRLALPLTAVKAASAELRRSLLIAVLIAAILFIIAVPWISGALTAPVEKLVSVARRVARGDFDARVLDPVGGELGELGEVFNNAVDRLSQLLKLSQLETRRYAAILEQMSEGVCIADGQGRIVLANAAFGRLLGVRPEKIREQFLEGVALNYELIQLLTRALSQGSPQRDEVRLIHPEARTLIGVATPLIEEGGDVAGVVALLHEVTDLYRMDRIRREFVANASHELRTPAAGIKALAEALQAGGLQDPERGPEFVRLIVDATDRLTAILDDMLVLTRVERGQELLRPTWVDATRACREAIAHVEQRAYSTEIEITCEVGEEDRLYADPGSLQTVLINLHDNAVKYTPPGGQVHLRGRPTPAGYELSVADTGIGIPEQDRDRIFERFYRVDKARDRETGGTGLGLAIVKHSVEAHGGRITVQSTVGEGSTFVVVFPNPDDQ